MPNNNQIYDQKPIVSFIQKSRAGFGTDSTIMDDTTAIMDDTLALMGGIDNVDGFYPQASTIRNPLPSNNQILNI